MLKPTVDDKMKDDKMNAKYHKMHLCQTEHEGTPIAKKEINKFLNNNLTTNAVSKWCDMKFVQKAEADVEFSCGEAYTEIEGYISSSQMCAVGAMKDTRACTKLCEDETACKSYECSIMAERCGLNWELKTTVVVQAGCHHCVKAADDFDMACKNHFSADGMPDSWQPVQDSDP